MIRCAAVLLIGLVVGCNRSIPAPLSADHHRAVDDALSARSLERPTRLERGESGFVIADFDLHLKDLGERGVPLSARASVRLLAIREALQPYSSIDTG